jgi:hypothetical protein
MIWEMAASMTATMPDLADAAGPCTGKAREKPGRQALVVLQDDSGFAGFDADFMHGALDTSIFSAGQSAPSCLDRGIVMR